jgi:hypothetical protein
LVGRVLEGVAVWRGEVRKMRDQMRDERHERCDKFKKPKQVIR